MNKIKYVSLFFKLFFLVAFVSLIAAQIIGWMYAPMRGGFFNVIPLPYQMLVMNHFSINTKIAGFFVSAIPLIIKLFILYSLIKLFSLYERLECFSAQNVMRIRNTGYALLLLEIVNPITDFVLGFVITSGNPPGYRFATMMFNDANVEMILTALVIILISWVMSEGCKLKEEQQLII
jgi:hypothetical protein